MRRCHACHQRLSGRPRQRPAKLHADKGYDYRRCRAHLRQRGIKSRMWPARCREQRWPGQAPLGRGTHARLVRGLRQAPYSLRASTRHSSSTAVVGCSHHLLAIRRPVVLAPLSPSDGREANCRAMREAVRRRLGVGRAGYKRKPSRSLGSADDPASSLWHRRPLRGL